MELLLDILLELLAPEAYEKGQCVVKRFNVSQDSFPGEIKYFIMVNYYVRIFSMSI
jgi:hypothetical protein